MDREIKRPLSYKVPPDKINSILVSEGRNETSLPKFNLKTLGINYEYTQSLLSLRVFKYLKNSKNITDIF